MWGRYWRKRFFCSGLVEKSGFCLRFVGCFPARPDQSVNVCVETGLGPKPLFFFFWQSSGALFAHKPVCVTFPGGFTCRGCSQCSFLGRMEGLRAQSLHRMGVTNMSKKDQIPAVPQVSAAGCQEQSPGSPPSAPTHRGHTSGILPWRQPWRTALSVQGWIQSQCSGSPLLTTALIKNRVYKSACMVIIKLIHGSSLLAVPELVCGKTKLTQISPDCVFNAWECVQTLTMVL